MVIVPFVLCAETKAPTKVTIICDRRKRIDSTAVAFVVIMVVTILLLPVALTLWFCDHDDNTNLGRDIEAFRTSWTVRAGRTFCRGQTAYYLDLL